MLFQNILMQTEFRSLNPISNSKHEFGSQRGTRSGVGISVTNHPVK